MNDKSVENLILLANLFFSRANSIKDTLRKNFQMEYKVGNRTANKVFPRKQWAALQNKWVLIRARVAMDEAFASAVLREEFTIEKVVSLLQGAGISRIRFLKVADAEWRERRMHLPTVKEKILAAIKELVARGVPAPELEHKLIVKTAGLSRHVPRYPWFSAAVIAARREASQGQSLNSSPPPPEQTTLVLPEGWVDLGGDVWDLRVGSGSRLKRNTLRKDIGDIAWPQMREDLLEQHLTCGTITAHFEGYLYAGELLGSEIPNVREATLEQVQRAWINYKVKPIKLEKARAALKRIFTRLYNLSFEAPGVNGEEMLRISCWLYSSVIARRNSPKDDYLSEEEMNEVITGCLTDIKAGLDFTKGEVDLLMLSTLRRANENASVVVEWASALMLLLMLFTGLRRQSIINLKVNDWEEIRPGLFALVWSHGKKREEKVAVLPTSVAMLINQYVQRTAKLRAELDTRYVFLTRSSLGFWSPRQPKHGPTHCLQDFAKRHRLERDGKRLNLNCLILRRTYVTRELYMGRSIWALRLQLGHVHIKTTKLYAKFDLYEPPSEVGDALDRYGRQALTLWHQPLLLSELDPAEREQLLGLKEERHQDVGMCRSGSCLKISGGGPPPCSLCEHLVTGTEFLQALAAEKRGRELELKRLRTTPGTDYLLAQKASQYELFKSNLAFVAGAERP